MVVSIWSSGEYNVCYKGHAAILKGFGKLSECLCLDSHCCYLVRFTAFIIPDRQGNCRIHFFWDSWIATVDSPWCAPPEAHRGIVWRHRLRWQLCAQCVGLGLLSHRLQSDYGDGRWGSGCSALECSPLAGWV